jgi:aryl-alcohol dehydrogenase-like predicted oxidoreductase
MIYEEFRNYKISKLSLGTVQFGLNYGVNNSIGKPSQTSVNEILDFVKNSGINSLDTANGYGDSESVLGNYGVENFQIITKTSSENFNLETVKKSLENLKVKKLFGLLLHDTKLLNNWTQKEKNILNQIKNLTQFFGVSIYTSEDFELAINNSDINIIQIPFNLFDQRALKENWFEKAKNNNKFIFIRSIYLQGLFLMDIEKSPVEDAKIYLEKLENLSKEWNISKQVLAMSFVKTISKNSSILFGCETLEQAKENINNFENSLNLTEEQLKILENSFANISENIYNPSRWNR